MYVFCVNFTGTYSTFDTNISSEGTEYSAISSYWFNNCIHMPLEV